MAKIFTCLGCPFYDPDYGCLSEHDWQCHKGYEEDPADD